MWQWMMGGQGTRRAMVFLEQVMNARAVLVGQ